MKRRSSAPAATASLQAARPLQILGPLLALAVLAALLAGCTPEPETPPTDTAGSSSASSADVSSAPPASSAAAEASSAAASSETAMESDDGYKDGSYTAMGGYTSPAGAEEVEVTITLKGDVVTAAEFTGKAAHPTSMKLQGKFKDGFSELVVGRKIDDISLTVVNGASLAPKGFMDALAKIKTEASA